MLAVPTYGVNDTGLDRVQTPASPFVLIWIYVWFAYSFIDWPWIGSSLEARVSPSLTGVPLVPNSVPCIEKAFNP